MSHPPIGTLLDYTYNAAHRDHIHVEPPTKKTGTPPLNNPGMSRGVAVIYLAMNAEFGPGKYFLDSKGRYVGNDPGVAWTHMGGWNRRRIAGTNTWSQHAYWNALDIGPYINTAQRKYINFLKGLTHGTVDPMPFTPEQEKVLKEVVAAIQAAGTTADFVGPAVELIKAMRLAKAALNSEDF